LSRYNPGTVEDGTTLRFIGARLVARRVIELVRGRTRLEGETVPPRNADRAAIVTHFARVPELTRSFTTLVAELRTAGYAVVVSSAADTADTLDWGAAGRPDGVTVVRKPNLGYDFGSAAVALDAFPQLRKSDKLLIVNDSNIGPFGGLEQTVGWFEACEADAWALTSSSQHGFHLQSFFLGFRGGLLNESPLHRFWNEIKHFDTKDDVIHRYEVGLSALLAKEGYRVQSQFSPATFDAASNVNLSTTYWLDLLLLGYPFVKRSVLRATHGTALEAPAVVQGLFGEDIAAWAR
jgi:hypothetical protein